MNHYSDNFQERCKQQQCRCCRHRGLEPVLDLGLMPLSDGFLTQAQLDQAEGRYPLELTYCPQCSLVQILETVPPERLFCNDYPYYSSFCDTLLSHSRQNVLSLIERYALKSDSFVVELASNDGYLLKNYVENGIPCLGIDPADGPADAAEQVHVPTLCEFFTESLAQRLVDEGRKADIIHANNVLAHVADTNGFVKGVGVLLKDKGAAVIEVPYVRELIDNCEFDTIYHEHLCYFSVTALDHLFRRNGLYLNDLEHLSIHGGSLRLYVNVYEDVHESVRTLLRQERDSGVDKFSYYEGFAARAGTVRRQMQELLWDLKQQGKSIAAYGAAAKGAIMLNYIGAGPDMIDFVADRNVHKQGKFMPGMHIPICEPARIMRDLPDYVLILAWNFKDEILEQQAAFRAGGGKFIIPVPEPAIV